MSTQDIVNRRLQPPTAREIYAESLEATVLAKEDDSLAPANFRTRKYPIPMKNYKSLGALKRRIVDFFDPDYEPGPKDWKRRVTMQDYALFMGFPSVAALNRRIKVDDDPAKWLAQGATMLDGNLSYEWLEMIRENQDSKSMASYLDRQDKQMDSLQPPKDEKADVSVTVTITKDQIMQEMVDARFDQMRANFFDVQEEHVVGDEDPSKLLADLRPVVPAGEVKND